MSDKHQMMLVVHGEPDELIRLQTLLMTEMNVGATLKKIEIRPLSPEENRR